MDDEEDVLEIGRRGRPVLTRVLVALVLVAAVGGYFVVHDRGDHGKQQAGPTVPIAPPGTSATVSIPTFGPPSPSLPPWPQVTEACGGEAFLPIVSATPLDMATGLHVVVGDRLRTVNVDTGAVKAAVGLPRGQFASEVATAGNGTYALLSRCSQTFGAAASVVRLGAGGVHQIARGPYSQLLPGGDHMWAVIWSADGDRPGVLDPLDGAPRRSLPRFFEPIAAYRDLIVGTVSPPNNSSAAQPFTIQLLDPVTGKVRLGLGPAASVAVDSGLIVWTPAGCRRCSVHTYDLATRAQSVTPGRISADANLWSAVVSPAHQLLAFVRQRSTPAKYETDHPGNPNEIAVLHLETGRIETVPGVVLWSKSYPGLAFSGDSVWLAITLDEGTHLRLLVWHLGMPSPLESPARLEGKVAYPPSVTPVL